MKKLLYLETGRFISKCRFIYTKVIYSKIWLEISVCLFVEIGVFFDLMQKYIYLVINCFQYVQIKEYWGICSRSFIE